MVRSNPNFNGSRTTTPSTQQQDTGSGNSGDAGRIYGSGSGLLNNHYIAGQTEEEESKRIWKHFNFAFSKKKKKQFLHGKGDDLGLIEPNPII